MVIVLVIVLALCKPQAFEGGEVLRESGAGRHDSDKRRTKEKERGKARRDEDEGEGRDKKTKSGFR